METYIDSVTINKCERVVKEMVVHWLTSRHWGISDNDLGTYYSRICYNLDSK
jgi:hypothetical protein